VAFLIAYHQNKALIEENGITSANIILYKAQEGGAIKRKSRLKW